MLFAPKKKTITKPVTDIDSIFSDASSGTASRMVRRAPSADESVRKPLLKQGIFLSQVFLLCVMTGLAGYFYYQYQQTSEGAGKREISSLVKKVGAMIELPEGEEPTLATVTNKERLDDQPFFRRAQNGDKILIYPTSGRAILYRPSVGKIIDVTTVNIEKESVPSPIEGAPLAVEPSQPAATDLESSVSPEDEDEASPAAVLAGTRIALYNGSTKAGMTNTVEASLQEQFPDVEIVLKKIAAKNDYVGYTVVALGDGGDGVAQALADALGGTIAELPAGETAPVAADILIILGSGI